MFYKDVNTYSPKNRPDIVDADAILQSVKNLILTRPGERLFNIEYGVNSEGLLFELMDSSTALELFNEIVEKINLFEPRVQLDLSKSDVIANPDDNSLEIKLYFEIEGFEDKLYEVTEVLR